MPTVFPRLLLPALVWLLALFTTAQAPATLRPALEKPNVIIIFLDDAGFTDFSHTGHPTIETPAITRLAQEGANFTQFYCASPACTASRYGLLTGRNPRRSGLRWVIGPSDARHLHPQEITLAEGLKTAGYATGMFGKWHLGNPNSANANTPNALPLAHGFDTWLGTNVSHDYADGRLMRSNASASNPIPGYEILASNLGTTAAFPEVRQLTRRYRDAAVAFIRAHKQSPFLAYIAPNMPHLQIAATEAFTGTSERGLLGDTMAEIDDLVATLRQTLEEENIAGNTLLIFTSDNGHWIRFQNEANHALYGEARIHIGSARPFRDGKGSTWEGGMRVPGIWHWPGVIPPHTPRFEPASTLDVLPTVFALAGLPIPTDRTLDGRDIRPLLAPTLFPGSVPEFRLVFTGFETNLPYAVRKGPWKLHTHLYSQTGNHYGFAPNSTTRTAVSPNLLFQLEKDPSERFSLTASQAAITADLQAEIQAFTQSVANEQTFWGPPP
jgi:arylsulfatase A